MSLASAVSPRLRGRLVFALAVGLFVAVTGWLVFGHRFYLLEHIGIGTMQPRFVDAHVITGARESLARGCDPLIENPGDPLGRALNYPRIWLLLPAAGLGIEQTGWLVAAFLVVFGLGLASLLPLARTTGAALLLAAVLFAPTTWLAVERGNCELAMFGLVAGAAWLVARSPGCATAVVGLAAMLKLYPVFALAGFAGDGTRAWRRRVLWLGGACVVYLIAIRGDLALIRAHTWHWSRIGYGLEQLPQELAARGWGTAVPWFGLGVAALLLAVVGGLRLRARAVLVGGDDAHRLAAFRMGAAVYVGSFCLGSNSDYRLMFLLLVVPQLAAWSAAANGRLRRAACVLATGVVVLVWGITWRAAWRGLGGGDEAGWLVDEVTSWVLVLGFVPLLLATLPRAMVPQAWRTVPELDGAEGAGAVRFAIEAAAAVGPGRRRDVGAAG